MLITIIRHGETDDNKNQIIQGHKDSPLNELGIQQARLTGQYLHQSQIRFDQIWSSDLQRAQKTARVIAEQIEDPPEIKTDRRLRERFLGELEGKPRQKKGPRLDPKSAEPHPAVLARLLDFWNSQIVNSRPDDRILIVSHGGAMRSLVESGLIDKLEYESPNEDPISFANCSITSVEITTRSKKVLSIATVDHLTGKIQASNANADDLSNDPN